MADRPGVLMLVENMSFTYDTRVRNISRTLTRSGYAVTVICPRYPGDPRRADVDGVKVRFYRAMEAKGGVAAQIGEYLWSLAVMAVLALRCYVRAPFQVMHLCNPPDFLFPITWPFKLLGVRVVFDMHDLCPELAVVRFGAGRSLHRVLLMLESASIATADEVLVTSSVAYRRALENGADARRLNLVRNGPADAAMAPVSPPSAQRRERPGGSTLVGYVGNMNPQDGLENLVLCAEHIVRRLGRTDIAFLCIGGGSSLSALRDMVSAKGLDAYVAFVGRMPPELAMQRLSECDFCVVPDSRNAFTDACLMVKAVEYVSLGKAFAGFALTETAAVCGVAGRFADDEDIEGLVAAIVDLADDLEARRRLEAAAETLRGRLVWTLSEPDLLAAYRRMAAARTGALAVEDEQARRADHDPPDAERGEPMSADEGDQGLHHQQP